MGTNTRLRIAHSPKVQIHCYETTDLDGLARVCSVVCTKRNDLTALDFERVQIPYRGLPPRA